MKSFVRWIVLGAIVVLLVIVGTGTLFQLSEDESAIIQRFGRIESMYVKEATPELYKQLEDAGYGYVTVHEGTGLRVKVPFIDTVIKYTNRWMTYDTSPRQVITSDKKKLTFDNNAQWRIDNPLLFNVAVRNVATARDRIDNILYSRMNEKVGKMESHVLITDKMAVAQMLNELSEEVTIASKEFGVTVFDVRIKRTDLPPENYESIYNRMITERNRIAAQYRSEGEEESIKIRSETDRQVTVLTSDAKRKAEILKGEGDGEAARIFNEVYGKNPAFFEFYNLLETYRLTVGEDTTLVIPNTAPFAKYLLGAQIPNAPQPTTPPSNTQNSAEYPEP